MDFRRQVDGTRSNEILYSVSSLQLLSIRPIDAVASPFETLLPLPGTHRWLAPSLRLFLVCLSACLFFCSSVLLFFCSSARHLLVCSSARLLVCSSAPLFVCSSVRLLFCSSVLLYQKRRLTSGSSANRYISIRFGQVMSSPCQGCLIALWSGYNFLIIFTNTFTNTLTNCS